MQIRDFIGVKFPKDNQTYFAEVKKVLPGDKLECRFVHTGSVYTFKKYSGWLEVAETTGAFKPGTRTSDVTLYERTDEQVSSGSNVGVTFDDGNSYLGIAEKTSPTLDIKFLHSGNSYSIDKDNIAHRAGGIYDGRKVLEIKTCAPGKSLFSSEIEKIFALSISDQFGKPMRGEFEAKIKADTGDPFSDYVYNNSALVAEDGVAQDKLNIKSKSGESLILSLSFHPALLPYSHNVEESSAIDRDTAILGQRTFAFNANASSLHFNVTVKYDTISVTSTSKEEAINTAYDLVQKNKSHTSSAEYGVQAKASVFFAEVTATDKHTTSDTDSSGTTTGSTTGIVTGAGSATTWNVYYPKGLDINELF